MGEPKIPQILRPADLKTYGICSWSEYTVRRRVKDSGFPAHEDKGGMYLIYDEIMDWFRGNKINPNKVLRRKR